MTKSLFESNAGRDKGTKILAKSLYKELRGQGFNARQIVGVSTELIGLVTAEMAAHPISAETPAESDAALPGAAAVGPRLP